MAAREQAGEKDRTVDASRDLAEVLQANRNQRHIIVLQDFPDPDAISSAFAHQIISSAFGITADIVYSGRISHQQNIALFRLLHIDLLRMDDSVDLTKFAGAVFVDNQGTTAPETVRALREAGVPTLIVVDHHERQGELQPRFSDIRRTGATATIYARYLESGLVELDRSNEDHVRVATALMHGIITDTGGLIRATPEDFYAAAFLSRFTDPEILEQIMSQSRSKRSMEIINQSLRNRTTVENFTIAGIGFLRAEDRDAIPQAADFLVTEENVHTAMVYGIVRGEEWQESVVGSLRTTKLTMDPDEFIKETFGKDAQGHYFGGGKLSAGGFRIPVGFLADGQTDEFLDLKWKAFDSRIKQKVLAKLGVEQNEERSSPPARDSRSPK
jgi:nanoRNase/pAp phosphatase (c-di-AMP/oligoRNAs hydrolase)